MSFAAQVPATVVRYFGEDVKSAANHPIVVSEFRGSEGWVGQTYRKRISRAWARKLQKQGVSHVALRTGLRQADFSIAEILRAA